MWCGTLLAQDVPPTTTSAHYFVTKRLKTFSRPDTVAAQFEVRFSENKANSYGYDWYLRGISTEKGIGAHIDSTRCVSMEKSITAHIDSTLVVIYDTIAQLTSAVELPNRSACFLYHFNLLSDELFLGVEKMGYQPSSQQDTQFFIYEKKMVDGIRKVYIDKTTRQIKKLTDVVQMDAIKATQQYWETEITSLQTDVKEENSTYLNLHNIQQYYGIKDVRVVTERKNTANVPPTPEILSVPQLLNTPFYDAQNEKHYVHREGRFLLLDFWFLGCSPCIKAQPRIEALYKKYKRKKLDVVGINCVDANRAYIQEVLTQSGILYKQYFGSRADAAKIGISSYPTYILVGKQGEVLYHGQDIDEVEKQVRKFVQ
jgi:thiol-disulfide isomerase/thioredoxin